jgi:hypothetical protein
LLTLARKNIALPLQPRQPLPGNLRLELDRGSPEKFIRTIHRAVTKSWGQVRFIAFLPDYSMVDRIISHQKLRFVAERPPPPRVAYQEVLMAAEASTEYSS